MYTLVSASVLAADLARHPAGLDVVDIVDASLRLGRGDLVRLGQAFTPGAGRDTAWDEVRRLSGTAPRVDAALTEVRRSLASGLSGFDAAAEALYRAPVGGFEELLELLRADVLGWSVRRHGDIGVVDEPAGVTAVVDALGASYARPSLGQAAYERLRAPWIATFGDLPAVAPADGFGPQSSTLHRMLDQLTGARLADFTRLHDEHWTVVREAPPWAPTMHLACSAAFVADRVRPVASAHLAAARAVLLAGLPAQLAAQGVMTAIGSAVQAVAVADLLDPDAYERLCLSWTNTFGPPA